MPDEHPPTPLLRHCPALLTLPHLAKFQLVWRHLCDVVLSPSCLFEHTLTAVCVLPEYPPSFLSSFVLSASLPSSSPASLPPTCLASTFSSTPLPILHLPPPSRRFGSSCKARGSYVISIWFKDKMLTRLVDSACQPLPRKNSYEEFPEKYFHSIQVSDGWNHPSILSNSIWSSPVSTHARQVSARLATTLPNSFSNSQKPRRTSDSCEE